MQPTRQHVALRLGVEERCIPFLNLVQQRLLYNKVVGRLRRYRFSPGDSATEGKWYICCAAGYRPVAAMASWLVKQREQAVCARCFTLSSTNTQHDF